MSVTDYDVIVIGGGASGAIAALVAAQPCVAFEQEIFLPKVSSRILLLEGQDMVGKKLLATGNGRCNLGNQSVQLHHYSTDSQLLLSSVLNRWSSEQTKRLFQKCGVSIVVEEGRYYPRSNRAESVRYALEQSLRQAQVEVHTGEKVIQSFSLPVACRIDSDYRFAVKTDTALYRCRYLVLATGGYVQPSSDELAGSGFSLAEQLHLRMGRNPRPALAGLLLDRPFPFLAGVRTEAKLHLWKIRTVLDPFAPPPRQALLDESEGEIQFTRYGISGIPAMCVSRSLQRSLTWGTLDLFPDLTEREVLEMLLNLADQGQNLPLLDWATTLLHASLGKAILFQLLFHHKDFHDKKREIPLLRGAMHTFSVPFYRRLVRIAKCFPLKIVGSKGYEHGQVMHGGLTLEQFKMGTLECKHIPGLYAVGEILDVDGVCGGYNLHWAWTSAACVGRDIAERLARRVFC